MLGRVALGRRAGARVLRLGREPNAPWGSAGSRRAHLEGFDLSQDRLDLLAFTRDLIALRRRHPALRRRFFSDRVSWLRPDGTEMTEEDWNNPHTRGLGLWLPGDAIEDADALLILLNASETPVPFVLPARPGSAWEPLLDTRATAAGRVRSPLRDGQPFDLAGRSTALLRPVTAQ